MSETLDGPIRKFSNIEQAQAGQQAQPTTARQVATALLTERIGRLRREANNLEALLNALPRQMPYEADEALWGLLVRR